MKRCASSWVLIDMLKLSRAMDILRSPFVRNNTQGGVQVRGTIFGVFWPSSRCVEGMANGHSMPI